MKCIDVAYGETENWRYLYICTYKIFELCIHIHTFLLSKTVVSLGWRC